MDLSDSSESLQSKPARVHPGEIVRSERHRQGMSMRELARRIGLTPSHLSKMERGLVNPSVGALWMISDELGIPVATLFSGGPDGSSETQVGRVTPFAVSPSVESPASVDTFVFAPAVDPRNRESIEMAGVQFQRLTPHDDSSIEFMEVRHEVGAGDDEAYHHRGREYGLVLKGRLLVELGFNKHVLDPGWSIAFDSSNPHRVINAGDEPAVAVWIVIGRNQP